jgi:hypothetical protein
MKHAFRFILADERLGLGRSLCASGKVPQNQSLMSFVVKLAHAASTKTSR